MKQITAIAIILCLASCSEEVNLPATINPVTISITDMDVVIDENPISGQVLGTVIGTASNGDAVNYAISSQSVAGALTIDQLSGEVTVGDGSLFDFEINPLLTAAVEISSGSVSEEADITVNLNDLTPYILGNDDATEFAKDPDFKGNFLLGTKYTVSAPGQLEGLGLIGRSTTGSVQMAIYRDNQGSPGTLVAQTDVEELGSEGTTILSFSPVVLQPGDYWVMAIYSENGDHTFQSEVVTEDIYYTPLNFGSAIPRNAAEFQSYQGGSLTYFLSFNE